MASAFRLRPPGPAEAARLLEGLRAAGLTYPEVGATAADELPGGYHHLDLQRVVGRGEDDFDRAAGALRHWQAHAGAGLTVHPAQPALAPGTDVLSVARVGPLSALAACRIVYAVDEPMRFGFAYGTLPLHPEVGEEAFLVSRTPEGEVTFRVVAFSRPAHVLVRAGGPISRLVQRQTARRYLQGIAGAVGRNG